MQLISVYKTVFQFCPSKFVLWISIQNRTAKTFSSYCSLPSVQTQVMKRRLIACITITMTIRHISTGKRVHGTKIYKYHGTLLQTKNRISALRHEKLQSSRQYKSAKLHALMSPLITKYSTFNSVIRMCNG